MGLIHDFRAFVEGQRPPQLNPGLGVNGSVTYKTGESGKPGYYTDYNLTVEHSFTPSTLLRTSFHANYGIKLYQSGLDFNQLDPKYFAIYGNLLTSPVSSVINNPIVVAAGFKLPYASFPQNLQLSAGASALPAVQRLRLGGFAERSQHLQRSGSQLPEALFHWPLADDFLHVLQDPGQPEQSEHLQPIDRESDQRHQSSSRLHAGLCLRTAVRQGQSPRRRHASRAERHRLGNWNISAVHRYQSGAPIERRIGCSQTLAGAGSARCSYVARPAAHEPELGSDRSAQPISEPGRLRSAGELHIRQRAGA